MNHKTQSPNGEKLVEKKFQHFGTDYITDYPKLNQLYSFPKDIWQQMAGQRLFGIGISTEFNGHGGSPRSLANAGKALVEYGGNMGIALSWLIHEILSRWLVSSFGTDKQKEAYLPQLANGMQTVCLAVSEPKVGAHPKHIKTTAKKTSDGYLLNGEKTYLTNGPIADLFIVIAVTGQQSGKNQFTAFIVPKDSPGLQVTDPIDFPFLRPSPHGGILLNDCMIRPEQVFGNIGKAYEQMVLPFRTIEDTMMMGLIVGGMKYQLRQLVRQLEYQEMIANEIAHLYCTSEALNTVSLTAADLIGKDNTSDKLIPLGLFFRNQAAEFQKKIHPFIEKISANPDDKLTYMTNDLSALLRIADNVSKIRLMKLGKSLFNYSP